jgi:hypothetical protein
MPIQAVEVSTAVDAYLRHCNEVPKWRMLFIGIMLPMPRPLYVCCH